MGRIIIPQYAKVTTICQTPWIILTIPYPEGRIQEPTK